MAANLVAIKEKISKKLTIKRGCAAQDVVGYKKLIVWQKANILALEIYRATKNFPKTETYGIISQLRRASLSVALNIVEGYGRQNPKELKQFCNIALGSLAETDYLIDFAFNLGYLDSGAHSKLSALREETGKVLWSFYKNL